MTTMSTIKAIHLICDREQKNKKKTNKIVGRLET